MNSDINTNVRLYDPMRPHKSPRYAMTREQLRKLARKHNVPRGRNTADTVANLRKAGIPLENTPCSLLPVTWGERTILVDVSPLTVDEFKKRAIAMLEAHIAGDEMVFPFIKANACAHTLTTSGVSGKKTPTKK